MQRTLSLMRSAVQKYDMIEDGDEIAVGVSGGKDSMLLLAALARMRSFYPKKFNIKAISVDLQFNGKKSDFSAISQFCQTLQIPYFIHETHIAEIIFHVRKETNPCSLCAKLRRGALHNASLVQGCNKVALGHHADDAAETFLMNLLFEGRIGCFSPVTYLDRKKITVIRPLCLMSEKEVRHEVKKNGIPAVKSVCPADGATQRQKTKKLLYELNQQYGGLKNRIIGSMQRAGLDGW